MHLTQYFSIQIIGFAAQKTEICFDYDYNLLL